MPKSDKNYFDIAHLSVGLRKRSVDGAMEMLAAQMAKFFIQAGSSIMLARLLTPQDFGLVGMVTAVTGFILLFNDLGLAVPVIQVEEINQLQVSSLFWLNVAMSAFLATITVAVSPLIAIFYNEPRLIQITAVSSIGFLLAGLSVQHQALLKRQMKYRALRTIDIISASLGALAAFISVQLGLGYWALVLMPLATGLFLTVGSWWGCGWRPSRNLNLRAIKDMLKVGGNLTGFNAMNYFARNSDNILIGRFWGAQALGLYANAYKLVLLPIQQINGPMTSVAVPALSRLSDKPQQYRESYNHFVALLCCITVPIAIFVIAAGDLLVRVVLGEEWAAAGQIFQWLGFTILTQPIGSTTGWIFITQNRSSDMFRWGVIGSILSVLSILIGLPWGGVGVAISYSILGVVFREPLLFWFIGRTGPIRQRDFYAPLRLVVLPASVASIVMWSIRTFSSLPLTSEVIALLASLILVFVAWFLSPLGKKARAHVEWLVESARGKRQPANA